jgi:hypothetical protein
MSDPNQLIYENSNTYRIHADNLRWTLLGGYAAIFAAVFSISDTGTSSFDIANSTISFALFVISFLYLWILAIQNWFYNLFARFVDECEDRLVRGENLRTLQSFAKDVGSTVNPFHPAFFLAQLIVASAAFYFMFLVIKHSYIPTISELLNSLSSAFVNILTVVLFIVYFGILNFIFKRWDKLVYKRVIKPFSNLYNPIFVDDNEPIVDDDNKPHNTV